MLNTAHKVNITLNVPYSWWERMFYKNTQREQRETAHSAGLILGRSNSSPPGSQRQEATVLCSLARSSRLETKRKVGGVHSLVLEFQLLICVTLHYPYLHLPLCLPDSCAFSLTFL